MNLPLHRARWSKEWIEAGMMVPFYGKDGAGIPFKGSLSLTTECRYVRLRYSKTVYSVTGGVLTISE